MSLPGSKPKKFYRKTTNYNPSLNSFNVTSLFNPQLYNFVAKRKSLDFKGVEQKMKNSEQVIERGDKLQSKDSLQLAKEQYSSKQLSRNHSQETPMNQRSNRDRASSFEVYPTDYRIDSPSPYTNLNYINSRSIKIKQLHGYNILNGY